MGREDGGSRKVIEGGLEFGGGGEKVKRAEC